jgi:hypothetical protein
MPFHLKPKDNLSLSEKSIAVKCRRIFHCMRCRSKRNFKPWKRFGGLKSGTRSHRVTKLVSGSFKGNRE